MAYTVLWDTKTVEIPKTQSIPIIVLLAITLLHLWTKAEKKTLDNYHCFLKLKKIRGTIEVIFSIEK